MHKKRRKAYRNLINALLNCNEGKEWQLLEEHSELLDAHFIQMMQKVAEELEEKGKEGEADFLRNLADSLISISVYQEIIEKLLNCASDEEAWQILDANRDWVDVGLQQTIMEVAEDLRTQGDSDKANFLMNIAEQLMGVDGNTSEAQLDSGFHMSLPISSVTESDSTENSVSHPIENHYDFLSEVLEITALSNNNPDLFYYLLLQNKLDKLDETFAEILYRWATATLPTLESEQAYGLATVIFEFSKLIMEFPLGNRGSNLEIAIKGYQSVAVFTRDAFPYEWATTQDNLGGAYSARIKGEKAENIETALACYRSALKVRTRDTFPSEWAETQTNLGNAYWNRIRGEKAENIETALACYRSALKVFTLDAFPSDWAKTQYNLALAYIARIQGEKAENIEQAISFFEQALRVFTKEEFLYEWAKIQNSLSDAYRNRIKGEEAENIEQAITCCEQALQVFNEEEFPYEWGLSHNNLGAAYSKRIKGEKAENIEQALAFFEQALRIFNEEEFLYEWAAIQNNLALAYIARIKGEKAENIEQVIACYQQALRVRTEKDFPYEWAEAKHNLALAYIKRIKGKKAENIEQAIACYQQALRVRTEKDFPYEWAEAKHNLALAYIKRIKGKKAENIEQAISCCQKALRVRTEKNFPYEWAEAKHNLALAYIDRIKEEKAENIEQAITCCKKALRVFTKEKFPSEWAGTQNNLGNAYSDRIKGEKAENLEEAISCYQQALRVRTRDTFPYKWSETQSNLYEWAGTENNLGGAYSKRIKGEKAENLEEALACYQKALRVRTEKDFPYEWAETQSNLGNIYGDRIKGEKAENLETALACYQKALRVRTEKDFPYKWAETQNNLAATYSDRIKGEKAENIERAIACCQQALRVRTEKDFPIDWATAQNNLGGDYQKRIKGEKAENLETAIACYHESLKVYTPEAFPYEWATTQTNLGSAYSSRIRGEEDENLEEAIACYRKALRVRTEKDFPIEWAETQNNLAVTYSDRIKGEKAENLETAIACYRSALKVYTPNAFPLECLRTGRNLGDLAFEEGNWQLAIEAYDKAVEAVELSRSWAMTPQSKQEVMEAAIKVYYNIVQASLNTEQNSLALEYVERSKTRNLVELLANRDLKPRGEFSPAILEKLHRLRNNIRTKQIYLANQERKYNTFSELGQPSPLSLPDRTRLKQLQQELDELIKRDISPIDPTFSLTQKVKPIPFSDIQSLIDERTAIVEWYITGEKILTFLVTHHYPEPQVWQSSTKDLTNLVNWEKEYLESYDTNLQQWIIELETRLQNLAKILHLDEIISLVPKECSRLILIPHLFLHIFPLHALPVSPQLGRRAGGEGKYLLDLFSRGVKYAPSCQLLKLAQNQQRPDFRNLFAIQNPTKDLIYTDLEVETIRSFFPDAEVLVKQAASEASLKLHQNLPLANCVHFSCHGIFNPISPLESHLVLAQDEANTEDGYLTLAEIFKLSLQQCRLVTLSACETGFTLPSFSDEYIGLPSGFLFAGSPSVVSSLWTVDDFSTAFLMIKFYENLRTEQKSQEKNIAVALKDAQNWLRNLTPETGEEFLKQIEPYIDALYPGRPRTAKAFKTGALKRIKDFGIHPFANPFYWAAFTATGF